MEELINILDQQFYYSHVDGLMDGCARFDKCAIIIEEEELLSFLEVGMELIGRKINQVVVISENLNVIYKKLHACNVLLISALDFKEAVRFSIMNTEITKDVVCVSKESEVNKIMESIM